MIKIKKFISFGSLVLFGCTVHANETDARMVFSNAATAAFTFKNNTMVEEISTSLPSFTPNGRSQLLSVFKKTGIIKEATKNNGSLQATVNQSTLTATRITGRDGLDSYKFIGSISLQWLRCVHKTCAPVGESKNAMLKGVAVATQVNNRPSYKIDLIEMDHGGEQK